MMFEQRVGCLILCVIAGVGSLIYLYYLAKHA